MQYFIEHFFFEPLFIWLQFGHSHGGRRSSAAFAASATAFAAAAAAAAATASDFSLAFCFSASAAAAAPGFFPAAFAFAAAIFFSRSARASFRFCFTHISWQSCTTSMSKSAHSFGSKYGCSSASAAVMRCEGSKSSILSNRSSAPCGMPFGFDSGNSFRK